MEESERQRKFELEKLKVESEMKQREIDALAKQKEIEAKEKQAERDFELKKLQLQLQSQATESQSNTSVDGSGDHAVSYVPNIKLMKLPPFNEEKDDLGAYLNRFERTCRAFSVLQCQWSFQLARFLQGQALDVYQRMTDEDVGDCDLLKNSLLKRFRLTEGGYRKRFKSVRIEVGETAEQFVDRLKKYLTKWREMAGFDATYDGLQNMILRDQIGFS